MPFRLNTKNVFLTFPQCEALPRALGQHLQTLRPIRYLKIVRERHQDGNHHLHVFLQWVDKFNLRSERFFDYEQHHPNIQAVRSIPDVLDYIGKALPEAPGEDDLYETGTLSLSAKNDKWLRVANAASETECIEAALEASPRDFVLQHDKILEYARKKHRSIEPYEHDRTIEFNLPPDLVTYLTNEFVNPVGLCPWILRKSHFLNVDHQNSIVLKRCCSVVPPVPEKQLGPDHSVHTCTGGACRTLRHSTKKPRTLSWTTSIFNSSPTKNNGGGPN